VSLREFRYAVAVREGPDLWLTLWVKRSPKGEFFVMMPRADPDVNAHNSYHRDGRVHAKSYDRKFTAVKRQPLTDPFKGTVQLGVFTGHGSKRVGTI